MAFFHDKSGAAIPSLLGTLSAHMCCGVLYGPGEALYPEMDGGVPPAILHPDPEETPKIKRLYTLREHKDIKPAKSIP